MCIYTKNNRAKFHPDPIWDDEALGFFCEMSGLPNGKFDVKSKIWLRQSMRI